MINTELWTNERVENYISTIIRENDGSASLSISYQKQAEFSSFPQEVQNQIFLYFLTKKYNFEGPVHVTEVGNFINILNDGKMHSRKVLDKNKTLFNDKASQDVLQKTHPDVLQFNRFYYRFKTPSHYDAKYSFPVGIVLKKELLFDSYTRLYGRTIAGNSYSPSDSHTIASAFLNFKWNKIFCTKAFSADDPDIGETKKCRDAEIAIRRSVSISEIKKVYVTWESLNELYKSIFGNNQENNVKCNKLQKVKEWILSKYNIQIEWNESKFNHY